MKNTLIFSMLLLSIFTSAQVAIGKTTVSPSVSLEFGSENRGLVLPWVTDVTAMTTAVNGTIAFNQADHKVKVKYAAGWKDLSIDNTGTTVDPISGVNGATLQNPLNENSNAQVSIGTNTATVPGILILSDTNKAMVLPKVSDPHLNIIDPAPGMIVFDTNKKLYAVFNGKVWSFWRSN
ncbi:hypothetical protein NZ698_14645 [Chryseobacterium sp. PBS4-4]|uniref:Uncharacterized protein n=1 Tax=Chryseobacterium edaphi TaxID=2976532 RepID=A0ABT2W8B4_9FLAO|nr:hypothetical protein [Chryseobacterium edaphi]MCU7618436.1 hypothetical protein [Chryseobacterium edaphi]